MRTHDASAMMHTSHANSAPRSPTTRAKVTNGTQLLAGVDGRSATARRFRDLIAELTPEAGGGEGLSAAECSSIRQAAAMMLRAEQLQAGIVRGEAVDADTLIRLSSEARRILASVRKRVRPAAAPPSPAEYLTRRAAERAGERSGGRA